MKNPNEFLVSSSGKVPKNLKEAIRRVKNSSAGFIRSWASGHHDEAKETSDEALEYLDYIQNEILRHRDSQKFQPNWLASAFNSELQTAVGSIVTPLIQSDDSWFTSLPPGSGALPPTATSKPLSLELALNKLKHRDPMGGNFLVVPDHLIFIVTRAGMGKPDTLSMVNVADFCNACTAVSTHI